MAQKQEIEIGITISNKENNDLTYTIVDKKEMNGILHYLIESRSKTNSGSIYLRSCIPAIGFLTSITFK